nr:hypothetical protein [Tanacetum cinerariifolium]
MEKTMLDLVKICHHKQLLFMHDNVDYLIESALDSKLLLINFINSQRLDKKVQEDKIVEEQPAERRNLPNPAIVSVEEENVVQREEEEDYPLEIDVILCRIYVWFPRSSYPLSDFSLGKSISI